LQVSNNLQESQVGLTAVVANAVQLLEVVGSGCRLQFSGSSYRLPSTKKSVALFDCFMACLLML
jgi:hypothetical protein